jgi:hypothetical protein
VIALDVETDTTELKHMAQVTFVKPENAFRPKDLRGHFHLQKCFKLFDIKRAIALVMQKSLEEAEGIEFQ